MSAADVRTPPIGLVLLAAGGSVRLGQPKQLLVFGGETLLRRTARAAQLSVCRPVVAVLGAQAERLRLELAGLDMAAVQNEQWQRGMGSSVRCGLEALLALAPDVEAAVFAVCDQPFLSPGVLNALADAHISNGARIAACVYGGTVGVPALFVRALFSELLALPDEAGAKQIISRHAADVVRVPFPEGLTDIDTLDDYARLKASIVDTLPLA